MTKMPVPRTHIRKVHALCIRCQSVTKTIMSTPLAYGYMRRHRCMSCETKFYSLAPYNHSPIEISPLPFPDRTLTEYEVEQRRLMWDEHDNGVVTLGGNDPIIQRLIQAVNKKDDARNRYDEAFVKAYEAMRIILDKENENARE